MKTRRRSKERTDVVIASIAKQSHTTIGWGLLRYARNDDTMQSTLRNILMTLCLCAFVPLCLVPSLYAKGPGTTAANFLKIGASGRQAAMGEATVGLADDANASLQNPAAWSYLRRNELSTLRTEWLAGISYTGLVYGHSTETHGNWGGSILWLDIPDIQGYDVSGGLSGKTIKAGDQAFIFGHGRHINDLAYGANLKFIKQELNGTPASALALDLGANWKTPWLTRLGSSQRLNLGAAIRNLGAKVKFIEDAGPLPLSLDLGIGYMAFNDILNTDIDLSIQNEGNINWRLGVEYWIKNLLALRLGYKPEHDLGNGISFGFGIRVKNVYFDYALVNFGELDNTHRMSLRYRFGGVVARAYQKALEYASQERYLPALHKLDEVLKYEPYNAEALSQWRIIKQIYATNVSKKETSNPYTEAVELFHKRRYLSAMDRFMEALLKQPERENDIRRLMAVIGAEMKGEELLTVDERRELEILVNGGKLQGKESAKKPADSLKWNEAIGYYKKAQYLKAHETFKQLSQVSPPVMKQKAQKYLKKIQGIQSAEARKKTLVADPVQLYALAFLAYVNGNQKDAFSHWQRFLEYYPQNEEVKQYLASTQDEVNKTLLQERLKHLMENGSLHFREGRYDLAKEVWEEALKLDPQNLEIQSQLRQVQAKLEEEKYKTTLKEYYEKAKLYYESGQWTNVINLLEELQKTSALEPETLNLLYDAQQQLSLAKERAKLQEAKHSRALVQPKPKDVRVPPTPDPVSQGQPVIPETVPPKDPARAHLLYQKGLIAYSQGNLNEAINFWNDSLIYNSDNERVQKALERALLDQKTHLP